jgi:hypothetical protein
MLTAAMNNAALGNARTAKAPTMRCVVVAFWGAWLYAGTLMGKASLLVCGDREQNGLVLTVAQMSQHSRGAFGQLETLS